jgi:hypothetical protein
MTMKVALVLYGQPRFLDNPHTASSHKRFILDRYETDVFCHTWWANDVREYDATYVAGGAVAPDPGAISKIEDAYLPKRLAFEPPRAFAFPDRARQALASKFEHRGRWTPKIENNLASHFYSLETAAGLIDRPSDYDFIVVTRLDVPLSAFPKLWGLSRRRFYVSDAHRRFPDFVFLFGPRFIASQKLHSRLEELIARRIDMIDDACGESIKYANFVDQFDASLIRPIYMPGVPVRSIAEVPTPATAWVKRTRARLEPRARLLRVLGLRPPAPPPVVPNYY